MEDEKIAKILSATTDKTLQIHFSQCPEEEYHNMGEEYIRFSYGLNSCLTWAVKASMASGLT